MVPQEQQAPQELQASLPKTPHHSHPNATDALRLHWPRDRCTAHCDRCTGPATDAVRLHWPTFQECEMPPLCYPLQVLPLQKRRSGQKCEMLPLLYRPQVLRMQKKRPGRPVQAQHERFSVCGHWELRAAGGSYSAVFGLAALLGHSEAPHHSPLVCYWACCYCCCPSFCTTAWPVWRVPASASALCLQEKAKKEKTRKQ